MRVGAGYKETTRNSAVLRASDLRAKESPRPTWKGEVSYYGYAERPAWRMLCPLTTGCCQLTVTQQGESPEIKYPQPHFLCSFFCSPVSASCWPNLI